MVANRRLPALVALAALALVGCGDGAADSGASSPADTMPVSSEVVDGDTLTGYSFDVRRDPG